MDEMEAKARDLLAGREVTTTSGEWEGIVRAVIHVLGDEESRRKAGDLTINWTFGIHDATPEQPYRGVTITGRLEADGQRGVEEVMRAP